MCNQTKGLGRNKLSEIVSWHILSFDDEKTNVEMRAEVKKEFSSKQTNFVLAANNKAAGGEGVLFSLLRNQIHPRAWSKQFQENLEVISVQWKVFGSLARPFIGSISTSKMVLVLAILQSTSADWYLHHNS